MTFKAAIWDLDGTLVDSLQDIAISMNMVLHRLGFPGHDVNTYKDFIGDGIEKLVERSLPEAHLDEATRHACLKRMRETYRRHLLDNTHPYQGIPQVLNELTFKEIKLAVLSNKPHEPTQQIVAACFNDHNFKSVVGAKPDRPKKPDPSAAVAMAKDLGVPVDRIVYFGDTATDMKTAAAAGMFPVGVLWGFHGPRRLLSAGAKILVHSPEYLLRWVKM